MEVVGLVDEQDYRLATFLDQCQQTAFPLLRLRRYLEVFLSGQVEEQGRNQGAEIDAVLVDRHCPGDQDFLLRFQFLFNAEHECRLAAADNAGHGNQLSFANGALDLLDQLVMVVGGEETDLWTLYFALGPGRDPATVLSAGQMRANLDAEIPHHLLEHQAPGDGPLSI